jgi:sugar/nucleoside kinase (ribokinase family)
VKELDTATSLDLCGVDRNSEAGRVDWKHLVKNLLPYIDFFVPSVEELCYMVDPPRYMEWEERAREKHTDITSVLNIAEDVKPLAEQLLSWGAKVLMIKCGSRGIYLRTGTRDKIDQISGGLASTLKEWADIEHFEISYKPDQVLSATGAGDTCIAAFLSSILNGFTWQKAIQYAAAEGASCVRAYDALSGLLTFDEMEQKIISGWDKNI